MLMQEVPAAGNLLSIQPTAPGEVQSSAVELVFDNRRIPLGLVQVLDVGEGGAHR